MCVQIEIEQKEVNGKGLINLIYMFFKIDERGLEGYLISPNFYYLLFIVLFLL